MRNSVYPDATVGFNLAKVRIITEIVGNIIIKSGEHPCQMSATNDYLFVIAICISNYFTNTFLTLPSAILTMLMPLVSLSTRAPEIVKIPAGAEVSAVSTVSTAVAGASLE